jgi:Glutathionylspermidine synthase preATP-grasp
MNANLETTDAIHLGYADWECSDPISKDRHAEVVRITALDGYKWDGQIGDVSVLLPFILSIPRNEWLMLAHLAELLAAELIEMEKELKERPDLWKRLGLQRKIRRILAKTEPWTPCACRTMRFDFHPTPEGWGISEVNSDVPGGYNEASRFTGLMSREFPGNQIAADPLATLADALAKCSDNQGSIALLATPGCTEDLQVAAGAGAALRERNVDAILARPQQLTWEHGIASVRSGDRRRPLKAIFRFIQGERMDLLPDETADHLFRGGRTPVCNPGSAVLTESKCLPLLWPLLRAQHPTWSRLLPTVQPPGVVFSAAKNWILKPAYGNTGDDVMGTAWTSRRAFYTAALVGSLRPRHAIAQRRFETVRMKTPFGRMILCIGIHVINGRACGIYGRMSHKEWIDYAANDIAVCVRD